MTFNAWPIHDVGDGNIGWIQGRIVGPPPLVAPLSHRPCFYYSRLVPDQADESRRADELMIEDDTGTAVVVLAGAMVQLEYDVEKQVAADPAALIPHWVTHREGILGPGETIAVYGHCRWERDPDISRSRLYRDPVPMRLRVTQTRNVRVWLSEDISGRPPPQDR